MTPTQRAPWQPLPRFPFHRWACLGPFTCSLPKVQAAAGRAFPDRPLPGGCHSLGGNANAQSNPKRGPRHGPVSPREGRPARSVGSNGRRRRRTATEPSA